MADDVKYHREQQSIWRDTGVQTFCLRDRSGRLLLLGLAVLYRMGSEKAKDLKLVRRIQGKSGRSRSMPDYSKNCKGNSSICDHS